MMRLGSLMIFAVAAAALLPAAGFAQSAGVTAPATPPVDAGPAPAPGPVPAEVMPPSARTGHGSSSSPAATEDATFVRDAAAAGMAEVRMGRLAERQAHAAQVRTFAERMVADHTKLGDQLDAIARKKSLTTPSTLDAKDSTALTALGAQHDAGFDRAYLRTQIADHQSALALFQQEAARGTDPDLKRFAADALPTLRRHLQMAQAANDAVDGRRAGP